MSLGRAARSLLAAALALGVVETTCQVAHRIERGSWLAAGAPGEEILGAFEPHPHLVGVPRPGFRRTRGGVTLSHNGQGYRGPAVTVPKPPGVIRIAAIGGSTTYGAGVSDDETWPRRLEAELGPGHEVLNLGVPGYSSAENVIQTALLLSDFEPDVALFYEGWNDLRNSHVGDLAPDYANFHARHLRTTLGLHQLRAGNRVALLFYGRRLVEATLAQEPSAPARFRPKQGRLTRRIDARVLSLYRRNLASLVALSRAQGIRPVLIPQVLNESAMEGEAPGRWVPLVRERDLPHVMRAFNAALVATARELGAEAVVGADPARFRPEDFLDHGHFSPRGHLRFARIVARHLRAEGPAR